MQMILSKSVNEEDLYYKYQGKPVR